MSISRTELSDVKRALLAKQLQKARLKQSGSSSIGQRPEGAPPPLSFAQQRMWFLHQWEPDSAAYNIPTVLRMVGRLNVAALRQAFDEIVRRHQVLQMIYAARGEQVVQIPHPDLSPTLAVVDIGALAVGERDAEVQRLITEEIQQPFDLACDLPIRITLLRLDEPEHVLLLTVHHIASDGWSMSVLIRELVTLYQAFCSNKPSPLPELPIQYADFAHWQRNWLQGQVLDEQMTFWKQQLAGAATVLELQTDHPRPAVRSSSGAIYRFSLPPSLTQAVVTISRQQETTPFMTWLAAFYALLYRYTGQNDIVVGSPIAGRNRSEIENLIGFFINTLVLRINISGAPSGRELLQQVRQATLEAYERQDLPFEKLVQELQLERNLSHSPLFQVMFNYDNTPQLVLELPGLTIEPVDVDNNTAKVDLCLEIKQSAGATSGMVTYNTDLFEPGTVRRMIGHLETLLVGMAADLECPVTKLPLLTPAERRQLLVEWVDTRATYPQVECVHQLFEAQVARVPGAVAVVFEEGQYTYRELNQRANQLAHHLQGLGVGPDVRVGLYAERSLDILVGLLGILKAGGAYVPLDPIYPQERIRFMLQDVQAPILVTQTHLAHDLLDLNDVVVICLDGDRDTFAQHSTENPPRAASASNLIYVLFTSGSTGQPKGVAVEHRHYLNYLQGILEQVDISPGLSFAIVSTFAADLGTTMVFGSLCTGGRLHVISYERAADPQALADYFRRHPIDVLKLVPSHFQALQGLPNPADIVPRRRLIFAGEACPWETLAQVQSLNPNCVVQNHYGPTETTVAALVYQVPDQLPRQRAATSFLGKPLGNTQTYILDAHVQPVPIGVPGELCVGGLGVSQGYLNRPITTAERFVPDPFSNVPGARLYRTSDLTRYQPDGTVEFLGRIDHQVKIRGYRIELGEIETLLGKLAAVQDAVVIARDTKRASNDGFPGGDKRLVAYVVPHPDRADDFSVGQLRDFLREQLPDYMVPTAFVTLEAIPLNPNGKVDRFALPAPDFARPDLDLGSDFVAPRNELESQIAAAWSEVLGIEQIGIDDNFFDLGGESFKAVRVVRKIGESVSVMDLFKHPSVRELAEHLSQDRPQHHGLLHQLTPPIPARQKTLSLVCVPHGGGNAITYQPLASALPEDLALYAVEIPGHDYSRRDEALQPLEVVARQCVKEIQRDVTGPLALYGHCLGGALAIEIARLLEQDDVEVVGVFLGGTFPSPRLPGKLFELVSKIFPSDRQMSNRAYDEFLRVLGGLTDAIDPQESAFMVRSMRHDAREAEDYYTRTYAAPERARLRAPILCIMGQMDRMTELYEERFREWEFFSDSVDLAVIAQAGHYFLKHQAGELVQVITDQLATWNSRAKAPQLTARNSCIVSGEYRAGDTRLKRTNGRVRRVTTSSKPAVTPTLRIFFLIAFGQFISMIGTGLTAFALGVWVFQQTGSVSDFAFISVFALLPFILLLPIAGAVADRWDRRLIMILSDVAAACTTLLVALLLWTDALQIWHVYVAVSAGAIANAFQGPAYVAATAQLVPKQYLGHANGIVQLAIASRELFAPLMGGALVVAIGLHGVVLIDFVTFLFAVTTLLAVRFPNTLFRKREEPLRQEIVGGWRYIIKRPGLKAMVAFFTVHNFFLGLMTVLVTPLVLSFGSAAVLGRVTAANGIGALLGGLTMSLWGGTKRRAEGMVGSTILFGLAIVVMGLRPTPLYPAIGLFGFGFFASFINAHWHALIQTKVGLELQGRIIAANQMLAAAMMPLGFVLAGPLADKVFERLMTGDGALAHNIGRLIGVGPGRGLGLMIALVGAVLAIWGGLGYRYRPLRFMEDHLPDAIPDAVILADKDELQGQADRQLSAETV